MENRHLPDKNVIFKCPLCNAVPEKSREDFCNDVIFNLKHHKKGEVVVKQGAKYDHLYILIEGVVETEISDEKGDFVRMEQITAPNPLAAGFLFASYNHSPVTAVTTTDSVFVVIPKENIRFLMSKYNEFMLAFLSYISNKLAFFSEKLHLLSLRTIRAKLAYYLLRESNGSECVKLTMSKESLSRLFSVSRPALVKVMMELDDEGIIHVDGRTIVLKNRGALQRLI